MTTNPNDSIAFLRRIDLLVLFGAIITLFLALTSEPWWTIGGTTTAQLFNIQVSPFYLHISAAGFPSALAGANALGLFTRVLIFLGFLALFAAGMKPTSWWRNLAVCFGLSSIAELYLSFLMMLYWAETAFIGVYGVVPPYYGTKPIQATILGLDLNYYTNPAVTATFAIPYYLGFLVTGLVLGRSIVKFFQNRAIRVLTALLPGGGVHDVYLTPPYQHVWFTSGDRQFNPLSTDPERVNDDELLVSFQKLYETVEPGGTLSVILPAEETNLAERFQRLMPDTGFSVESAGIIYRTEGKPENELRFRKPLLDETIGSPATQTEDAATPNSDLAPLLAEGTLESASPPVLEVSEEPGWIDARMTQLERAILKVAIETITRRQQPVPYRELLNHVYMELVNSKREFDSAKQIETTLLDHNGREVILIEEADEENGSIIRKWALGDRRITHPPSHGLPTFKFKLPKTRNLFTRSRRGHYEPHKAPDDDTNP